MSPRGIDLELLARHATWPRWGLGQLAAGALVVALLHPSTAPQLALVSPLPIALLLLWPIGYGVMVVAGPALFRDPRGAIPRTVCLVHAGATIASVGACSSLDVSPAYGLLLLAPPCWGHLFPGNRTLTASLALAPVALRALTVPEATPSSLGVAAVMGGASALAFLVFSWRRLSHRGRERRRRAAEASGASSVEQAADRWVARRLHDRLSGVLMLAQARGEGASVELARGVVAQARAALDAPEHRPIRGIDCAAALREAASALHLAADVRVCGAPEPSLAWSELLDLVIELAANHARHGSDPALSVELALRGGAVHARVAGRSSWAREDAGRGRRNLALRAAALDGSCRWDLAAHEWTVQVSLQAPDTSAPRRVGLFVVELGAHAAALVLLTRAGTTTALAFTAMTAALTLLNVWDVRRDRQAGDAHLAALRARIAAAVPRAVGQTRAALGPLVDALERAGDDPAGRRVAIESLARGLGATLAALEAAAPSAPPEEPAPHRGDERLRAVGDA